MPPISLQEGREKIRRAEEQYSKLIAMIQLHSHKQPDPKTRASMEEELQVLNRMMQDLPDLTKGSPEYLQRSQERLEKIRILRERVDSGKLTDAFEIMEVFFELVDSWFQDMKQSLEIEASQDEDLSS